MAAALHDIGIWTAGTFDYLDPSIEVARAHLEGIGRAEWIPEVEAMIREHHRISAHRSRPDWLVEPFRRADWADVTLGLRRWGLSRAFLRRLRREWPNAGFHLKLVRLTLRRLLTHPWSPIPVLRW